MKIRICLRIRKSYHYIIVHTILQEFPHFIFKSKYLGISVPLKPGYHLLDFLKIKVTKTKVNENYILWSDVSVMK